MSFKVQVTSDKFDEGTLRILCAEQVISALSLLCINQKEDCITINANVIGEALHGIELLLGDGRRMLESGFDREQLAEGGQ